jgi:hypothetical protein
VRKITCIALDDLCRSRAISGTVLLKVDVDGKELDVLQGALETLKITGCAIVETVFFGDGPNHFRRVADFMAGRGFAIYDIVEPIYRPGDMALWQVDTVFVPVDGPFRRRATFADEATMKQLASG